MAAPELLDFLSRGTSLDRLIRFSLVNRDPVDTVVGPTGRVSHEDGALPVEQGTVITLQDDPRQRVFRDKAIPSGEFTEQSLIRRVEEDKADTVFTFRINPARLKISRPKIEKYHLTKNGFERQFWHNDLIRFDYEGSSGVFRPHTLVNSRFDITTTFAWQKFRQFERFYNNCDDRVVQMTYWGYPHPYEGSLNDFSFSYDPEKNPNMITYSFKYTALPLWYVNILTAADYAAADNAETVGLADSLT